MSRYPFTKNILRHMYCTHLSYVNFFLTLKCQNSHVIKHKWWVDQLHYSTYLWIWVYIHGCILFSCHAGTNKHFIYYSETFQYRKNRRYRTFYHQFILHVIWSILYFVPYFYVSHPVESWFEYARIIWTLIIDRKWRDDAHH